MNILAIDQSYTSSGIVVLNGDDVVFAERFVSDTSIDKFERAWNIADRVILIAKEYNVKTVGLEGLAFAKTGDATRDLAGLQYVIVTKLRFVEGYDVTVISPNTVKKVATGKGNAKKEVLLEHLPKEALKKFQELGVKKTTGLLDLTDAYWIGIATQQEKKKCLT